MLYESETWCLNKKEVAILRRKETSMLIAMCGVKWWTEKHQRLYGNAWPNCFDWNDGECIAMACACSKDRRK